MVRNALRLLTLSLAFVFPSKAEEPNGSAERNADAAEFVGRYDGSSFESAMRMIIREDGTFAWGLSVGALDLRAEGSWQQDGQRIVLTSYPVPVAPEFRRVGFEIAPNGPLVKVVWATNGEPFQYASINLTCHNGAEFYEQVYAEGWSPPEGECDKPVSLRLTQSIHGITSKEYDLSGASNSDDVGTLVVEFHPNDIGVADFSGLIGVLEEGMLKLQGGEWPLELRKLPPS